MRKDTILKQLTPEEEADLNIIAMEILAEEQQHQDAREIANEIMEVVQSETLHDSCKSEFSLAQASPLVEDDNGTIPE